MLAIGPDLDAAVDNAVLLEWASELYWRAAAVGTPRTLDAGQAQDYVDAVTARDYGALQARRDDRT
jgi:L-fuculose-phosphate aldolase